MSYTDPFAARGRALEEVFYQKEIERVIAAMREKQTREQDADLLARTIGMSDPEILDPLLDLGLRASNVTALIMAPLVAVAWADNTLDPEERTLIDESAAALGIDPTGEGEKLLEFWLDHKPSDTLLDAWVAYVRELREVLGDDAARSLRLDIVARAKKIAGSLKKRLLRGRGPSEAELDVIHKIEAAFEEDVKSDSDKVA